MQDNPTPPLRASDFARRLGAILLALAALVAHGLLRDPFRAPLIVPLWNLITRAARRLDGAFARFAAGIVPRPRAATPGAASPSAASPSASSPRAATPDAASPRVKSVLPTRRGWLTVALGSQAAAYATQIEFLLAEPEAAEALAGSLAARRILAPIRHMLGVVAPRPRRPRVRVRPQPAPAPLAPPRPIPPAWMREFELPPSAHLQWMPPRRCRSG